MHLLTRLNQLGIRSLRGIRPSISRTVIQRQPLSVGPLHELQKFHSIRSMSSSKQQSDRNRENNTDPSKKDGEVPIVKFKESPTAKEVFKKFYSLYGPVFMVCHIGVSLCSLGFFCSLVWLSVDLRQFIPDRAIIAMGEKVLNVTEGGGKFVFAYAAHKLIFPLRLGGSMYITKIVSPKVNLIREKLLKKYKS